MQSTVGTLKAWQLYTLTIYLHRKVAVVFVDELCVVFDNAVAREPVVEIKF